MNEKLLQFIWQFQYFNKVNLFTVEGDAVEIINTGTLNTNQGADFLNATIKINKITLVGNIEIHIHSSDWNKHKHTNDKNYNNVILHIVWINDTSVFNNYNSLLPTIELNSRVSKILLDKYNNLMETKTHLPCAAFLPALSSIGWIAWKERLATERLIIKSEYILSVFNKTNCNWEETFWQMLAYNFGLKLNAELFAAVAASISIQILAKHKNQIHQLEALLLGQANLLKPNDSNSYAAMLYKEFLFLQHKYQLKKIDIQPAFLRMRPSNFPTIRLAQLAMLIHQSSHLFSKVKQANTIKDIEELFSLVANEYWNYHYTFQDDEHKIKPKNLGSQMINTLIINAIIPTLFAYANYMQEEGLKYKAITWLQQLAAEKNTITNSWEEYNIENKSAFDSQALLELSKNYCTKKMCLKCAVGNKILRK